MRTICRSLYIPWSVIIILLPVEEQNKKQEQIIRGIVLFPLNANNSWQEKGHIVSNNLLIPWNHIKLEHTFNDNNYLIKI